MKKTLYIFLLSPIMFFGQNLIPNFSFEEYSQCPNDQNQIIYANDWNNFGGSPDYFNTCSLNPLFSVPNNWVGNQNAHSGNAYSGIGIISSLEENFSEYIGVQLTSIMNIGQRYYVSLKVSLGLDSTYGFTGACDNLGVLFSTITYDINNVPPKNNFAHINSGNIIVDTSDWINISGSFIADSNYQYAIIGRFYNDVSTTFVPLQEMIFEDAAYYLIDDVCVSTDSLTCDFSAFITENVNNDIAIEVYPNPITSIININFHELNIEPKSIIITDLYGKIYMSKNMINEKGTIKIEPTDMKKGIYFLTINLDGYYMTKKIILN